METITNIYNVSNYKPDKYGRKSFEGYIIETTARNIMCLIDNDEICRESFGCISSDDNFNDFIGLQLIDVYTIDEDFSKMKMSKNEIDISYSREKIYSYFIELKTTNGNLQFAVYNNHNGYWYYGHDVYIIDKSDNI